MAKSNMMTHSHLHLRPDPSRTVIRPFMPEDPPAFAVEGHPRVRRIAERVLGLDQAGLREELAHLMPSLASRHRDVEALLLRRFGEVSGLLADSRSIARERKLLIGAYFCEEYSFEAAALFNPSMVLHPDQSNLPPNRIRFLLSLRGIGEGHVSSVTFRTGSWGPEAGFVVDPPSGFAVPPRIEQPGDGDGEGAIRLRCDGSRDVSETVLFPVTSSQRQGIEDVRLVRFTEEDGGISYLGTYTAFDGRTARSELLYCSDFHTFLMQPLIGAAAGSKGMALFPRKIDGRFVMLGRQDNENIWLLDSDEIHRWEGGRKLVAPRWPWEFVQMGNCGSPIEIEEGWLVLTHGVGMARNYCMGACLLDKKDPSRKRDGYVPNVVYSCGGLVHDRTLLVPYGVADNFATFASVPLEKLLTTMS